MQTIIEFYSEDEFSTDVTSFPEGLSPWVKITLSADDGTVNLRVSEDHARELLGKLANELARPDLVGADDVADIIESAYVPTDQGVAALACDYTWHDQEFARCVRERDASGVHSQMADWCCARCGNRLVEVVPHEARFILLEAVYARDDEKRMSLGCMKCGCIPASPECVTDADWMPLTDRPAITANA